MIEWQTISGNSHKPFHSSSRPIKDAFSVSTACTSDAKIGNEIVCLETLLQEPSHLGPEASANRLS